MKNKAMLSLLGLSLLSLKIFSSETSENAQFSSLEKCIALIQKQHPTMPHHKQIELANYKHRLEMAKYSTKESGKRRERLSDQ